MGRDMVLRRENCREVRIVSAFLIAFLVALNFCWIMADHQKSLQKKGDEEDA